MLLPFMRDMREGFRPPVAVVPLLFVVVVVVVVTTVTVDPATLLFLERVKAILGNGLGQ